MLSDWWRSKTAQVLCILSSGGIFVTFRGQILYADRESLTIGDSGNSKYVTLKIVELCGDIDSGETPKLTMYFSSGGHISLPRERESSDPRCKGIQ
jgi:hypothetical protein